DFANHNNSMRLRIIIEHFNHVKMRGSIYRITTDTNTGGLTYASARELPNCLVSEGSTAGDDTNIPLFVYIAGGNADAATAGGILAFAGSNDARTIRTDQTSFAALHRALDLHHVIDGNALGNTNHQIKSSIDAFQYRVRGKCGWNKNGG